MKDFYVPAETRTIVNSTVVGAVAGALTWGLSLLVQKYFLEPVFCRSSDSFMACANGGSISFNLSLIIVSIAAVAALVRVGGYRPLLVAIAAVATLWSANEWLGAFVWWEAVLWLTVLSAAAYLVYSWVARVTSFPASVVIMVMAVVAARLILL